MGGVRECTGLCEESGRTDWIGGFVPQRRAYSLDVLCAVQRVSDTNGSFRALGIAYGHCCVKLRCIVKVSGLNSRVRSLLTCSMYG